MPKEEKLPPNWETKFSKSKEKFYFYNVKTKQTQWTRPDNDSVRASHILIKHKDSRRPSSWKEETVTRTKEEAQMELEKIHELVKNGEDFAKLAAEESHCSSAKKGGDLGPFPRGAMQKPFEDAAFALKVGEISEIISTDSGLHIIKRTE